jgi:NMD protein affecting ribosome stability and mRNA decay
MISILTEIPCPICGKLTVFRHMESANSLAAVVQVCEHAKSYTQDGAEITVEFVGAQS